MIPAALSFAVDANRSLRRRRAPARSAVSALLFATAIAVLAGCACYHFGADSLFPPDIHTVYVPMFESDSLRRDLGEQLTESVCKEIERRTPFKVVGTPNADSVLTGRIITDTKHVIIREPNNEGRVNELGLVVAATWANRRGIVQREGSVPVPPELVTLTQTNNLIPEYGQSTESSLQKTMQGLATKIVDMMEAPW